MKRYQQYLSLSLALVAFNSNALQCGAGDIEVDGVCVSSCKILQGTGKNLTWDSYIWGDNPRSYCIGDRSTGAACQMSAGPVSVSVEGGKWTNKFTYTGSKCDFGEINRFFGDTPDASNDLNQNGVDDAEEDFDGDGIKNSEDLTPFENDRLPASKDLNGNGIPDTLEPVYDRLIDNMPQVVTCDSANDRGCGSFSSALTSLVRNNRQLSNIIATASISNLTHHDLRGQERRLKKYFDEQGQFTRRSLDLLRGTLASSFTALNSSISNIDVDVDNSELITMLKDAKSVADDTNTKATDNYNMLLMSRGEISQTKLNTNLLRDDVYDVSRKIDEVTSTLYDLDAGLTPSQERYLKNASKASANNSMLRGLTRTVIQTRNDVDTVLGDVGALSSKIDNLESSISGAVDLSGVESSIQSLSDKIDGIDGADMSGVENKLTDLIDSVTNTNDFIEPNYDFDGVGFIVTQNQIAEAQNEVLELKQEMVEEFEKFKTLFSIDTSSFNNGTYKEHSLNLNVNHAERSFKSGVFEALLDNASFIAAVIMFLFVVSGIKMLGKD